MERKRTRRRPRAGYLALFLVLALCLGGCGGNWEPDLGLWDGDVYHNGTWSLSFALPEGWVAAAQEEREELLAATAGNADRSVERMRGQMDIALSARDGESGDPSVLIMVENMRYGLRGGQSVEDYLSESLEIFRSNATIFDVGELYEETICGETYTAVQVRQRYPAMWICMYARKEGKEILGITVSMTDHDNLERVLASFGEES